MVRYASAHAEISIKLVETNITLTIHRQTAITGPIGTMAPANSEVSTMKLSGGGGGTQSTSTSSATKADRRRSSTKSPSRRGSSSKSKSPSRADKQRDKSPAGRRGSVRKVA